MKKIFIIIITLTTICSNISSQKHMPEFSKAGFFTINDKHTNRQVFSMNQSWLFYKGDLSNAFRKDFDDNKWEVVSLPHGLEYLPVESSACVNYQGKSWYRKYFKAKQDWKNKKIFLHFEAIMGKSTIYINGKEVKKYFGGYLPIHIDISEHIVYNQKNLISVCADNSNDPSYPPGKPQEMLDFAYFGGIYRDCWLVVHQPVYITNPNCENIVGGGGLFVHYSNVSEKKSNIHIKTHIRNELKSSFSGRLQYMLKDKQNNIVINDEENIHISKDKDRTFTKTITLKQANLWSPDNPYLYKLEIYIIDKNDRIIDAVKERIGIRSIEFKGQNGFELNGKQYPRPLIGANRHQDFAVIGNALPNSLHWRDAKKLKDAGIEVIRNAHYPQDPAFMDACDELGLLVIVNTPGWQFWNKDPIFEHRVYNDLRNIIRRDRNHACVWMWEPVLNETWYPEYFAQKVKNIVEKEEYPYPYCYTVCDSHAKGAKLYNVLYKHPSNGSKNDAYWGTSLVDSSKTYFTREWGDNVDDWNSHNSPSRVARNWGEHAMLIQAKHYANPDYQYTSYNSLYNAEKQHVGGCLWHSFDHQRGYHPDAFYGGIMDAFRQAKYSYYMFKSQRPITKRNVLAETGAMVKIAHEMTPFSSKDVTVYSNCQEVSLQVFKNGKTFYYNKDSATQSALPSPIIVFENVYNFMDDKKLSRNNKQDEVFMIARAWQNKKLMATDTLRPARRPEKIILKADNENMDLIANGSDIVTIIAYITDKNGVIKRLNNQIIKFAVEGEAVLIGNKDNYTNPVPVRWGSAPILLKSTNKAGLIKITASVIIDGLQSPIKGVLLLHSKTDTTPAIYEKTDKHNNKSKGLINHKKPVKILDKNKAKKELKKVEKQQESFE